MPAGLLPLSFLAIALAGPAARAVDPPPNIVLVVADDLGYGELGCYGQEKIETPRIDRMAAEGVRFTQFYSGAPVCAPARCTLLTGMHSGHATIRDNLEHKPEGQAPILDRDVTIAEVLRAAGYRTGCFGKWGLGYPGSEGDPLNQGFDRFFGYNCQRQAHNFYPRYLWSDRRKVPQPGNDRGLTGERYSHDVIEGEALRFIRENRERAFFCYVPFTIPHLALQVPEDSLAHYRGRWEETPYRGRSYLPHDEPRAAYAAMITRMDRSVGRILDLLDELGIAERTLVLFTSDNGPTHLNPQVDVEFFDSTAGLRGLKGSVYEGGIRVPMIARWTGHTPPGSVRDDVHAFWDVLATCAELAGVACPPTDGISFVAAILGREPERRHEFLVWDFPGYGGQQAVRLGDWKAVRRGVRKRPDAPFELYDLSVDPGERRDVAADHPDVVERARALLLRERGMPVYERFRFGDDPELRAGR